MIAYTDGACDGKRKSGSAAVLLKNGEYIKTVCCSYSDSTNNRAELRAAILAMENCDGTLHLISDSQYVLNGLKNVEYYHKRNYENLKNSDLWKMAHELRQNIFLSMEWVKGHNGNFYNELADSWAVIMASNCINQIKDEIKI